MPAPQSGRSGPRVPSNPSVADDRESSKRSVLLLRWLVIIATSYLALFSGTYGAGSTVLLICFIASNLLLTRVPVRLFFHTATLVALVIADSTIVSVALLLSPGLEGEVFILYFFVILLAAAGGSFTGVVVAAIVVPILYVFSIALARGWSALLHTEVLLRLPFIFCVSVFYGFLSERARRDRARAELAELSERAKTQLFSTLSHDVRNGLGSILGFTEMLVDGADGELPAPARRTVLQIQSTSLHIAQLISNLLDAVRIEEGELHVERAPVALGPLLISVTDRYTAQASLKKIQLETSIPPDLPPIRGDELQLDRVFANLLSNALKFTPEGGHIGIRAGTLPEGPRVDVEDTGPGVPEPDRDRIFAMYHQTERGRHAGGAGLGLFVVRTILDAHGAKIDVQEVEPRGARFRVTFPAAGEA